MFLKNKNSYNISMVVVSKDGLRYFPDIDDVDTCFGTDMDDGVNKYDYGYENNGVLTEVEGYPMLTSVRILSNEEALEFGESMGITNEMLMTQTQISQILTEITE